MIVETTQKVDPEVASDMLNGLARLDGFICGYVRIDAKQFTLVTLIQCKDGDVGRGQREVRYVEGREGANDYRNAKRFQDEVNEPPAPWQGNFIEVL